MYSEGDQSRIFVAGLAILCKHKIPAVLDVGSLLLDRNRHVGDRIKVFKNDPVDSFSFYFGFVDERNCIPEIDALAGERLPWSQGAARTTGLKTEKALLMGCLLDGIGDKKSFKTGLASDGDGLAGWRYLDEPVPKR